MSKSVFIPILIAIVSSQRTRANQDILVSTISDDKPIEFENCKVEFCAHGDDDIQLDLSQDGGLTYPTNLVPLIPSWQTPLIYTYSGPLSTNTQFQFTVTDSCAAVGGFIASIQLYGSGGPFTYITSGPGNNIETLFDVSSSDGITTGSYVYDTVGTGAWGEYWTSPPQSCLNWELGMEWVWNGQNCNTMTFEFGFDEPSLRKLCDPVPTPKPTEAPTEEPSVAPTQCDFCDISLQEYLDMCYCDVNGSADPGIGCGGFDNCVAYYDGCNWCHCTGLGLVCTKKYCPRDEYEEAYCNDCEDGYVLNSDHECVPIGSAQSVNPSASVLATEVKQDYLQQEFNKINEMMGYQKDLMYGLIAINVLTIISLVCVCSSKGLSIKKRKDNPEYGGINAQESDAEDEMIKA